MFNWILQLQSQLGQIAVVCKERNEGATKILGGIIEGLDKLNELEEKNTWKS